MTFVGSSVAVSSVLATAPLFTAQALRYALACLLLLGFAAVTGRRLTLPRGREWFWLIGVTVTGLLLFNVALVRGSDHAEPAVFGVAVACVPLLLAVIGPMHQGRQPTRRVLIAALVVTAGAVLVQGLGRSDAAGIGWAILVLGCEAGFTLLALPVLGRHGALGVSVHSTWLAAIGFPVIGLVSEGPGAAARLTARELLASGYLAVAVTAVAFMLWYTCVRSIGAGRAGLLTGIAPIAAAAVGVLLGGRPPQLLVWLGIAVVALGLVIGMVGSGGETGDGGESGNGRKAGTSSDVPASPAIADGEVSRRVPASDRRSASPGA